jgi:uncharacterized membrane protein
MADRWDEHTVWTKAFNLLAAYSVHTFFGLFWVLGIAGIVGLARSAAVGWIWGACALALWLRGAYLAALRRNDFGAVWGAIAGSWLLGALGPIGVAYAVYSWLNRSDEPVEEPVNPELERRLDRAARRLEELSRELAEIRRLAVGGPAAAPTPEAPPPQAPTPAPPPPPQPIPTRPYPAPPEPQRRPSIWERDVDLGGLLGAKGLAWAGGIVTVLGVVFFFVLAVNRGWIGPVERVGLGALASLLVFSAGLWVHRRFGPVYSAYGAVGAGIAGGYATLVAAAALYDLVSDLGALAIAGGIASVGLVTSLRWGSELVAGIGLIGATLVPMMVLFEEDLSPIGTAFAGIVFAATAAVGIRRTWARLVAAGFVASLVQIAILVGDGSPTDWDRVVLAGLFSALYVAAGWGLNRAADGLPSLSASLVIVAGVLAGATGAALFAGDDRGWAMLVAALAFGGLAAALFPRPGDRDLSALLGAIALALVAVGLAIVVSGPSLAIAWAAEAAVLAWLARRIDEPRYWIASLVYLGAAAVEATLQAPPSNLYEAVSDPAASALAPFAVAVGGGLVAFYSREWAERREAPSGFFAYLEPVIAWFRATHAEWRTMTGWLAGIAAVFAASLSVLGLAQFLDDSPVQLAFERGQVFVIALWGVVALGLVLAERRLDELQLRVAGLLLAAATLVHAAAMGVGVLEGDRRGAALLVAAAGLLAVAFADAVPPRAGEPPIFSTLLAAASAALAFAGLGELVDASAGGVDLEGFAWLALAAFYAALAAFVFHNAREFSLVLGGLGLLVAIFGSEAILDGTWLVLAWSATAAALAVLARLVDEERIAIGAAAYLGLALANVLLLRAQPDDFFQANSDPAAGVPSILFVVGAALVWWFYGVRPERVELARIYAGIGIAVLSVYGLSLAILGAFEWLGTAGVETDFQRGHSAVSTFWGVIGLVALYVGLRRGLRALRLAGFALFALALAKIFLYDLANLSSITRALSFLAVGAVLLLAGFFYQRLTVPPRAET